MTAGATTVALRGTAPLSSSEGERLLRRTRKRIWVAETIATLTAACDVFLLLWFVLPMPEYGGDADKVLVVNAIAGVAYLTVSFAIGMFAAERKSRPIHAWLTAGGRPPTDHERARALRIPLLCARVDIVAWTLGAVFIGLVNVQFSADLAWHVGSTIFMGGLTCTALVYLLVERFARPITARALASNPSPTPVGPGVKGRLVLAWVLATGVPLAGLLLVGCHALLENRATTADELAFSMIVLGGFAATSGLVATLLVAKSLADPLTSVRKALGRIESGDLDVHVRVDDGSEVGLVQTGFNRMAAGLRERERLRDLFGRHVGHDVASAALDGDGPALGGEVRDVAVLFVDLVGSTQLAATRPPREVVKLLNDVFAVVVDVVARHGGWVNKFEGDAALCVFGAPADHDDPAGAACAAARMLRERLTRLPDVDVGIGLSAGPAVAGNIGAEQRFEYTVIGDPVNEAARLCELAKRRPERVLASDKIIGGCRNGEGGRWAERGETVLRGRVEPTRLASPV